MGREVERRGLDSKESYEQKQQDSVQSDMDKCEEGKDTGLRSKALDRAGSE